jgi:uncharacterized membrane protein
VCAVVGWVALLIAAPFLPPVASAATYAFGSLICHQLPERSFHIGAYQLPVCARCFGLYSGAAMAGLSLWVPGDVGARPRDIRLLTAAAAIPTAVTVAAEWGGIWMPSNAIRAAAGAPLGFVAAFVVMRALRYTTSDARLDG